MALVEIDFAIALQSEKIFQLQQSIGNQNIFKSVSALLKLFSNATKVNKPLTNTEIILCADWIIKKYTHDSLADIALALKDGIFGNHKFYGSVTVADVKEVVETYFETKAEKLEQLIKSNNTFQNTIQDPEILKITQAFSPNYAEPQETFQQRFQRERREKAGREFQEFQQRIKEIPNGILFIE
jgi:hypothetical protein